jgi:archaeosortase A (PGF-CTERM-specific)
MKNSNSTGENTSIVFLFLFIPTLMLIFGYIINPDQYPSDDVFIFIHILIVIALILLGAGFFTNKKTLGKQLKIFGWLVFAFYWSTQPATLYLSEGGDIFNAALCIVGVYVLSYIAYHEWLSIKRNEEIRCLNWIAGAAFIAGVIYFGVERTPLELWLRQVVASHSGSFLEFVTGETVIVGGEDNLNIFYKDTIIRLIFACTAVQAMVIFVGMIIPLQKVEIKRKIIGLLITVIPVYILNFMRNALVAFLTGNNIVDFNLAHNAIAKIGALITLIILLLIVIKIIPEIMDEIICLTNLPKRNGPIEKVFKKYIWRKK